MKKTGIREAMLKRLKEQSPQARRRKSLSLKEKLFVLPEFKSAKCVMFYVSMPGEVDTGPMIEAALKTGKRVVVPVTLVREKKLVASLLLDQEKDLSPGPLGTRQPRGRNIRPVPPEEIDLVVVPGVAFDKDGNRLGRGAGYYDKFLGEIPKRIPKVGLAFDFQVLESLPALSHDVPVTTLLVA